MSPLSQNASPPPEAPPTVTFTVADEAAAEAALQAVQERFTLRPAAAASADLRVELAAARPALDGPPPADPAAAPALTWYDTFDWRLHKAGGELCALPVDGGFELVWDGPEGRRRALVEAVPAFAWDLPAGDCREALAPVIEMRRLLPVAELARASDGWRLLGDEEKTVVRLRLERRAAAAPGGPPADSSAAATLPPVLRVSPVRGFDEAYQTLLDFLTGDLDLARSARGDLADALAALGRRAGDYSSKVRLELEPSLTAAAAARVIHRSLLDTLTANEEGVRRDLDSEFLHDFRVAVRRTRAALSQIRGVFPDAAVERFRREFSWLGSLTGPTRDLDVYLLKIADYRSSLPPAVQEDLDPLTEFLRAAQRREQRRLAAGLESARYRRLIAGWQRFLTRGEMRRKRGADAPQAAERPAAEVASERIWKVYRRIVKRGRQAVVDGAPAAELHRLRIECKKLRYLLEFFRSLYPPAELDRLIAALKQLQDNLGDFNDYEVQREQLRGFAHRMVEEGGGDAQLADTLLAMGRLLARLEAGQAAELERFGERFASFTARANRRTFRELFKP